MKFIADRAIPHISEAFSTLGDVTLLPASEILPAALAGADGLVTRTTVKISADLLSGSSIRFIGTATIGTDHIDLPYLKKEGIHLVSAPGCNANAVGEYVLTALLALQRKKGLSLQNRTLGIIGAGNTGKAVKKKVEALGISCLMNDPPLAEQSTPGTYLELSDLLSRVDIVSVHVPLTRSGKHPTYHLVNEQVLGQMKPGTILINTSRGEAIDGNALKKRHGHLAGIILDVWENEPLIDPDLISSVDIATPHIAGYSIEGKIGATEAIYQQACDFFKLPQTWQMNTALAGYGTPQLVISKGNSPLEEAIGQAYDIRVDDESVRRFPTRDKPGEYFANLRNQYHFRREFSSFDIQIKSPLSIPNRQQLIDAGFRISNS